VILAVTIVFSSTARANGRFPEAQTIETVPRSDGKTVFLRATFGILVSRDRGSSWQWICERALGYEGQWDPPITVTADGRLWVGLETGLRSTTDGCEVVAAPELEGHTVKDLTTDPRGETVWAITGAPGKTGYVWRRRPASPFERLASFTDTNLMTIEVAPASSRNVYVSGQAYTTIRGRIFRSDDGGVTFHDDGAPGPPASVGLASPLSADAGARPLPANALVAEGPFFIGSVDAADPGRLLVRHLHAKGSDLLLSRDGGRTFTNVLSMTSAMFGFARSVDGKTIWAASGLPEDGVFRSTDRGEHFASVSRHGVLCLHAAPWGSLFFCENSLSLGAPAIAVATDGVGAAITPLVRFADVEGPVRCAGADARASLCASSWPETQAQISIADAAAAAPSPALSSRPRRGSDGGSPAESAPSSKCGCEAVGWSPRARFGLPLTLLAFLAWRGRRYLTVDRPSLTGGVGENVRS
jgi:hypothetical protein